MRIPILILLMTITAPASAAKINFLYGGTRVNAAPGVDMSGAHRDATALVLDIDNRTLDVDIGPLGLRSRYPEGVHTLERWENDEGFGMELVSYAADSMTVPRGGVRFISGIIDIGDYDAANNTHALIGDLTYHITGTYQTQYKIWRNGLIIESGVSGIYPFAGQVSASSESLGLSLGTERPSMLLQLSDHTGVIYGSMNEEILFSGSVGGRDITLGHVTGDLELQSVWGFVPEPTSWILVLFTLLWGRRCRI